MSYETLVEEIKELPEECISELNNIVISMKLRYKAQEAEGRNYAFEKALAHWRAESEDLFANPDDASFMEHAFDVCGNKEMYKSKEIW